MLIALVSVIDDEQGSLEHVNESPVNNNPLESAFIPVACLPLRFTGIPPKVEWNGIFLFL